MEKLVIPLEISGADALKHLQDLESHGWKAGKAIDDGAKDAAASQGVLESAIRRVNIESMAWETGKQMLDMLSQGAIQASQDLKRMADEFINLRDSARELAGVLGTPGNIEFTKDQLKFAADTGFADPSKAVDFRTAFQGEANQYAGRFNDPKEFEQFEKEAARLGNQNNVPANVMAKIAGMAIRTGPEQGQTSENQMQRLGGSFKTMMAGSGSIAELAGQLSRMSGLVGKDNAFKTMEEAAVSTRMAAETNLPEAYTTATEIRTGVIELSTDEKKEEKAKELGITPETTNFEAIKKLSDAQKTSGQNMAVFLKNIFPMKKIQDSFRDSIKAYRDGVTALGLKDAAKVTAGQIEAETSKFFVDPLQSGMLATEKAKTNVAEGALGEDRATIAPFMQRAKTKLAPTELSYRRKMANTFMDTTFGWLKGSMGQGYKGFEEMETTVAMRDITRQAQAAGIDTSNPPSITTAPQRDVEHYMADLVRLTKEANDKRNAQAQRPLAAPAPQPQPNRN